MFGRSNLQIHANNDKTDQSASYGCIILNKSNRVDFKSDETVDAKKEVTLVATTRLKLD